MAKTGRPLSVPKNELEDQIKKLAMINCTWSEISAVIGMPERTLRRRFASTFKVGKEQGKMSLRRKMFELAVHGNVTMLIWLSKQHLHYSDQIDSRVQSTHEIKEQKKVAEFLKDPESRQAMNTLAEKMREADLGGTQGKPPGMVKAKEGRSSDSNGRAVESEALPPGRADQ